jgi:F0F1-type ATP synthase delta subunit
VASFSRRQLANYAVDEMLAKRPLKALAARLSAAMTASGQQRDIELLISDIDQELEERGLLARAQVTSAWPLSLKAKQQLVAQLKNLTNTQEVAVEELTDKNVIGGIKVETASRSWDKTIKRELTKIREIV